jgi:hypothetical protein
MVIKSSADEVSFSDLATETGATQISLGDLYSSTGGKFFGNPTVPSTGAISMTNMLGKTATNTLTTSATWPSLMTTYGNGSAFNIAVGGSSPDVQYQLTSSGTLGTINGVYNGKSLQFAGSFTCSFEIYVSSAQADALFFFAGCTGLPQFETDTQNGFLVTFDVYSGFVSGGRTAPGIYLVSPNAGTVTTSAFTVNSTWENVTVTYTKGTVNTWQVSWRGTNVMTYNDSNNSTWLTTSGQYWGIGARTGGLGANFYIRRVNMSYTGPSMSLPVTSGLMGHYIAESYTPNTWRDLSGAGNHATTSGTIYTNPFGINGKAYIYGDTSSVVQFPAAILPSTYTIFHICRYNGATRTRILSNPIVGENWLSGFWGSRNGVAYHNNWVTDPNYSKYALTDWVLSSDQNILYRANKLDYTTSASGSGASSIGINNSGEVSDWAISCLFVYNRTLSLTEIIQMEDWLGLNYLNPIAYPPASMTGNTTNISGQPFGNGTYIASASSEYGGSEVAFSAFDNNNNTIWTTSSSAPYNNRAYTGNVYTLVSGTNHYGEWLQIQMPIAILPTMYAMRTRAQFSDTCPYSWVLAGSINGSTWIYLDAQPSQTLAVNTNYNFYLSGITAKYNYFRFIVKNNNGNPIVSIADLKIYSKELPSSKSPIIFDASTLTGVDNQISIWNNSGSLGSLYNATGLSASSGSKPVLRKIGTYNHVEFNRNNSSYFIMSTAPPLNWFNNSGYNGMTIFIVGRYQSTAAAWERWLDFGSGAGIDNFWIGRYGGSSTIAFEIFNGGTSLTSQVQGTNYAADTNWHIWIVRTTNSASGFTVNWYMDSATAGYTYNFSGSIANRTPTLSYIGKSNWADAYLYADLRELQIYNTAISDADIINQYNMLKAKWGM